MPSLTLHFAIPYHFVFSARREFDITLTFISGIGFEWREDTDLGKMENGGRGALLAAGGQLSVAAMSRSALNRRYLLVGLLIFGRGQGAIDICAEI